MKKSTKRILLTAGASAAAIYAYNHFVETTATKKNLLGKKKGEFFTWKDYQIFYTKKGTGSPLLLIHDTDSSASSEEWSKVVHSLENNHTVYTIDLLGCGRSDKPSIEYTNYLYVQLISSFVKEIIQNKTIVIATNLSASFVIMANHMDNTLFEKMILINPISLKELSLIPDKESKMKKRAIELPFVGTFIYNLLNSTGKIDETFRKNYYEQGHLISHEIEDVYYEAAHTKGSQGRFLYSSKLGNYLNWNIIHAVKNITTPTLIIGSKDMKKYSHVLDDYHKTNSSLEIMKLTHGNLYPHLEVPEKIVSIINDYSM